jgi:cytochrome c oxidase assembly protein subunit 15
MKLFRALAAAALALCLCVVVFGAYVRLSDAGLGCPDWPTCYGQVTVPSGDAAAQATQAYPSRPLEQPKAWKEMIHRYLASTLGLLILGLFALSFRDGAPKGLPRALLALVIFQGVLGMWTVTWLLKPLVVTAHLLGGMTTLALLCWLWLDTRPGPEPAAAAPARELRNEREAMMALAATPDAVAEPRRAVRLAAGLALSLLALQIFLGGWTSTNYAALACPDLPTCQGQWWPDLKIGEAFTFWRGLGQSYEHGVLDNPTRMTIHHLHRVGAIVVALVLGFIGIWLLGQPSWRRHGHAILGFLGLQLALGVTLVLAHLPLLVAAAHNAGAALLLLAVIRLNHAAWRT